MCTPPSFALCGSSGATALTATAERIVRAASTASAGVPTSASFGRRTPYSSRIRAPVASSSGPERPRRIRSARPRFGCGATSRFARPRARCASTSARIAPAAARCPCRNGSAPHFRVKAFASPSYASGLIDTEAKATPEDR